MAKRLLGIGATRKEVEVIPDLVNGKPDSASILSIPTDRSERIKVIDGWKEKRKKRNDVSSADSVLSDVTFSMAPTAPPRVIHNSPRNISSTDEFILECDNGERIYVPSAQGVAIKSRCRYLRQSLETNKDESISWGAASDSDSVTVTRGPEQRIITKKTWSPRTARHLIELLGEGSTWIQNDQNRFVELLKACDEINIRLHLGSPINYHDVLDPANSVRYFKLSDHRKFCFQLAGTIHSYQWIHLIEKGILLHLDSEVLMLSTAPSVDRSEDSEATKKRLAKCDELYSEFNVYSGRSRVNTLYTILNVLSSTKIEKKLSRKRSTGKDNLEESIKIVCKIVSGGLSERDLNTLWRMTSSSFTLSTPEEQSLLQSNQALLPTEQSRCSSLPFGDIRICDSNGLTASTEVTDPTEIMNQESIEETSHTDISQASQNSPIRHPPATPDPPVRHETRTITGKSFVALKHVFDPVNRSDDQCPSKENWDPSLLPACLSIRNPRPDTLGRFLNACAIEPRKGSDEGMTRIGYEILPSSANGKHGMLFYASNTTRRVKEILNAMADYSGTSVVGDADFRLEERRNSER
eukprot:CAMPEP_0197178052 /NCGR_PEP_ID=MMETSP1423-20130617/3446_1 /TAXON_ID=476441 /ORGANISM="Pseudo-nitzschia heimii, Strain UNC1101" /LENGTH=580 /DNA_ID=CAMNT_0042627707 /DNA_START=31 /DNA_END=1773 /DNA_ORIENTATION=-